jgi:putative ABC transport system permease protein
MNDLFGLSMTYIMAGLLAVLAVAASTVGWVLLRNRVLFFIGVRNIPRRRAQTILIIIGLMLSTLIISTAFSIGDTVDYSITNQAFDRLHSIDEVVQAQAGDGDNELFSSTSVLSARPIPQGQAEQYAGAFKEIDGVDGAVSVIRGPVPVSDERAGQSEPFAILVGVDEKSMAGFPDIESVGGAPLSLDSLGPDEVYANASAADKLDIRTGDAITMFAGGQPNVFTVKDIVKDRVLSGVVLGQPKGFVMGLARAQQLFNRPDEVDLIAVSNDGGVHDSLGDSKAIVKALDAKLQGTAWRAQATKRDAVDAASEASSFMVTFFVILGLFSIAAGMLLIFLIFVMLAAERRVEMGMVRAVGTKRRHLIQMFMSEGMAYNTMAAAAGCALGVAVSMGMVRLMALIFAQFDLSIAFHVTARSLVVSYSMGVVLTFLTVTFSSWRISSLNIVAAIRELTDSPGKHPGRWSLASGIAGMALGGLLIWAGLVSSLAFPFGLGLTCIIVGAALTARFLRAPSRAAFTTMGLVLLVTWLGLAGGQVPFTRHLDGDVEMFFLSGVTMVLSSTFVLVYNADLMLGLLTRAGGGFSHLIPSIRTAVAYPMANKFRTGMTIAMISLVMFALVMMSTMQSNFDRLFLSDDALGGYQVEVNENPSNPIADLKAALEQRGFDTSGIARVDDVSVANTLAAQVRMAPAHGEKGDAYAHYPTYALSDSFIANNEIKMQARAEGLASDADVWRTLAEDPDAAVIDAFALPGGGMNFGGPTFKLSGVTGSDTRFAPPTVEIRNAATGASRNVRIVGIISTKASQTYYGLGVAPGAFADVFERPESTVHFVRLAPGTDATAMARGIERTLLSQGVQADSLRKLIDDSLAQSRGFLYLIQGFMGIGLFVGIAAVGVIAFRTVVERRQQIGMLRALGYTRNAVALSFVMESSFVALLGVLSGIGLAVLLAHQLLMSDEVGAGQIDSFYIPWLQISGIGGFAFMASLVMTIIPSRQASSIPIAEALRYE